MWLNLCAALAHAGKDVFEPEGGLHFSETHFLGVADALDELCGGDKRFGRDASVVQAIASHLLGLDERGASTEP